jgi:hypothetical protein
MFQFHDLTLTELDFDQYYTSMQFPEEKREEMRTRSLIGLVSVKDIETDVPFLVLMTHNLEATLIPPGPIPDLRLVKENVQLRLMLDSVKILQSRFLGSFLTEHSSNMGPDRGLVTSILHFVVWWDVEGDMWQIDAGKYTQTPDVETPLETTHVIMGILYSIMIEPTIDRNHYKRVRALCDKYLALLKNEPVK